VYGCMVFKGAWFFVYGLGLGFGVGCLVVYGGMGV